MILDEIRTKICNLDKLNIKYTYLILYKPTALELFYYIQTKITYITVNNLDNMKAHKLFGLKIIILNIDKSILEVG
jgi:hypothetical protein